MKEFDIENFPTSRTALDMLHSMPEDFYKDSYVMKWLLQVTGTEWDSIKDIIEGLPLQFFPETATWGLIYHEQKWQLPVKYNLGYGERRKLIYQRRDFKAPMTPYKMELYIEKILGIETHITDCHDPGERGYMPGHPNIFKAIFITENTLDVAAVSAVLNKLKQSHTVYTLEDLIQIIINNCEKFLFISIDFRFIVPFWGCKLVNGTKLLDGSGLINASRRYNLVLGVKNNIKAYIKENIYTGRLYIKILPCYNVHENINGLKTVFRLGSCWFFIFSNGKQDIPLSVTMPVHASIAQEINIARLVINGIEVHTEEKTGAASVLRAAINSLPVKPGLPLKTGFVSQINTSQNTDVSSLVYSGMEVHTEEKAGAASGLKAGINHYKTPGGTRVTLPASTWYKAAVVTHESIQGFTVITEPVQVVFDSSGLANAGFEVVYNGNVVLNPESLTVYKGDLITINILPGEHYSLADGAYVFSTGTAYGLDNGTVTIKIKHGCTTRITAKAVPDRHTVNFIHDLTCGFELEHNGKKYINPQSLVVAYGDEINIRLLTTHNGNFASSPTLTYGGKVTGFDGDGLNCYKNITVNGDMDITVYTDYIFGPYDNVYPDDDFDPLHKDTQDIINLADIFALGGAIPLSASSYCCMPARHLKCFVSGVFMPPVPVEMTLEGKLNGREQKYTYSFAANKTHYLISILQIMEGCTDVVLKFKSLSTDATADIKLSYTTKLSRTVHMAKTRNTISVSAYSYLNVPDDTYTVTAKIYKNPATVKGTSTLSSRYLLQRTSGDYMAELSAKPDNGDYFTVHAYN